MPRCRPLAAILSTVVLATLTTTVATVAPQAATPSTASTPGPKTVIANLFEWNWASVASECTTFLGPRGYGYVQVSPPQEHVTMFGGMLETQPVGDVIVDAIANEGGADV